MFFPDFEEQENQIPQFLNFKRVTINRQRSGDNTDESMNKEVMK